MKIIYFFLFLTSLSFSATGDSSCSQLFHEFYIHIVGNIGKFLALFGFMLTFIIYIIIHKGSVLFIGVIVSIILGAILGFSSIFNPNIYEFLTLPIMEQIAVYFIFFILYLLIALITHVFTSDIFSERIEKYKKKIELL